MRRLAVLIAFLLVLPAVYSKDYHISLLAVKEIGDGFEGSSADLYLELREGQGRVFLDTYPLTKLDTQMSTRFAKEVSCSQNSFDCDNYDFIYTIKSNSVIIGGPSAGAAIALLTISALENIDLNENITITGTINSGGLIGPVGGLKEKIEAASQIGLKIVLIPKGERIADVENSSNITDLNENTSKIDLVEYGSELGINIIEVSTINEALSIITGKQIDSINQTLDINKRYIETMKGVADNLCERTSQLKNDLSAQNLSKEDKLIFEDILNLTDSSKKAFENEKYYSAASYCFGSNTKLSYLLLKNSNITISKILTKIADIKSNITKFNQELEQKNISTVTDLETYMIVKERLIEAEESVNNVVDTKNISEKLNYLAYSIERLNSAYSWSNFFDMSEIKNISEHAQKSSIFDKGEKEFVINKEEIKKSCINKIAEAEERLEYLKLLTSVSFEETEKVINLARTDFENENYELCLFEASKAKADSDTILNMIGIGEDQFLNATKQKLIIIKNNLIKEQQKGIFPVIGYSYYEYANDLKERDIYSSMLFAEYSLELSNLDIYFKKTKKPGFRLEIDKKTAVSLILMFVSGLLIGIGISSKSKRKK